MENGKKINISTYLNFNSFEAHTFHNKLFTNSFLFIKQMLSIKWQELC